MIGDMDDHRGSGPLDHNRAVLVVTGDDDQFSAARRQAMDLARRDGRALILYDWDAPTLFGDPLPTWWSGEGSEDIFSRRLDSVRLRAAGRAAIADQVDEATRAGIDAFAWLPSDHGAAAVAAYAKEQGASLIVISAALEELKGLDAVVNGSHPAETLTTESRALVLVVDGEATGGRR
jgi:hypothetical protein